MANDGKVGRRYEQVAEELARRIGDGRYEVGGRLPSERDLAQAFGVSRPTVREAIIALELDGLIEVRQGSGVYVAARRVVPAAYAKPDVGPFEILEARRAFETEACAIAAARITDDELAELERLVEAMDAEDVNAAEEADHAFHIKIAEATQNSVIIATVQMLWDARRRSPQSRSLDGKAHVAGVIPIPDEHMAIVDALRSREPARARAAMRAHISRVTESLLRATEVHEIEQARAKVAEHRRRFLAAD